VSTCRPAQKKIKFQASATGVAGRDELKLSNSSSASCFGQCLHYVAVFKSFVWPLPSVAALALWLNSHLMWPVYAIAHRLSECQDGMVRLTSSLSVQFQGSFEVKAGLISRNQNKLKAVPKQQHHPNSIILKPFHTQQNTPRNHHGRPTSCYEIASRDSKER